jgi:hypothetical protein
MWRVFLHGLGGTGRCRLQKLFSKPKAWQSQDLKAENPRMSWNFQNDIWAFSSKITKIKISEQSYELPDCLSALKASFPTKSMTITSPKSRKMPECRGIFKNDIWAFSLKIMKIKIREQFYVLPD